MDFSDIINDLKKLEGICLNSIRPGAEITITEVDSEQKKVLVRSKNGKIQSRSFVEFQRIWEALMSEPAVRVEEVLNGSGSSRNQPETIFANLPYIQWLKLDNKKHISFVGKPTHAFGTLQQMDSMRVAQLSVKEKTSERGKQEVVLVVTDSVAQTSKVIMSTVGKAGIAEVEGLYVYELDEKIVVLADSNKIQLPCGTYIEVQRSSAKTVLHTRDFLGYSWRILSTDNFKSMARS